jgi:hypothetical protein
MSKMPRIRKMPKRVADRNEMELRDTYEHLTRHRNMLAAIRPTGDAHRNNLEFGISEIDERLLKLGAMLATNAKKGN